VGISTGNLGDWKSGKSVPSAGALIRIAERFQVSLDWLMLGRQMESSQMMENMADYFFEEKWQLNYHQLQNLSEEERRFIREYIEFTEYRKKRR
jgi:transcriptional regulator with XRE-family HTH domain